MSGLKVAAKNNGGSSIPASDRKLVSSLKEVVPHSEDEIYAMLKECNRDPDETVQRLLSQEKFHVVKRKKDKKKEPTKDASDARTVSGASPSSSRKGGRNTISRGSGRGASLSRGYGSTDMNGAFSKVTSSKENGVSQGANKGLNSAGGGTMSYSQLVQPKSSSTTEFEHLSQSALSNGHLQTAPLQGSLPVGPSLQGAWLRSGHGTVADMLKSKTGTFSLSASISSTSMSRNPVLDHIPVPSSLASSDHVLTPSTKLSATSVVKQENPAETQHLHVDRSSFAVPQLPCPNVSSAESSVPLLPRNPSVNVSLEGTPNSSVCIEESHSKGILERSEAQITVPGSEVVIAAVYQADQLLEAQQGSSVERGASLTEANAEKTVAPSSTEVLPATINKLQELTVQENRPVIIPDHIRVSEADCTMLSFGSFGSDFDAISSNLKAEKECSSVSRDTAEDDSQLIDPSSNLSVANVNSAITLDKEEELNVSASAERLDLDADATVIKNDADMKAPETFEQAQPQHTYTSGFSVANPGPSDNLGQYLAEGTTQPEDINTVLQQSYDSSTYYSGMFRSGLEVDARYSSFLPLTTMAGKLGEGHRSAPTTQDVSSQEAATFSNSNSTGGQKMQVVSNSPTNMAVPQQSLPVYATQLSGLPFPNVFSYQYMPPGFSYMQTPYQHNYLGSGNYHQVPSAANTTMKYPLPQYKTGGAVGGMHTPVASGNLGYGGYTNSQPGSFPVNTPVTARNASNFEEPASQQFKETNVYVPNQQVEGPSVWLQSQLVRDLQNSSYYNVGGQNQPTRYSQAQSLLARTHPGTPGAVYSNIYHHQQPGSLPTTHQLLQQPVVGSAGGALGSQIGSYQQAQRAQQTWANGF